ncbi:MAG: hypothetical protein LUF04_07200 [Bacteroides sp.]|nr:hypothetical protein [Bacteroides sp.]
MVRTFMNGVDKMKVSWHELQLVLGRGSKVTHVREIASLKRNIKQRDEMVDDTRNRYQEANRKSLEALKGIDMKWNSERSLGSIWENLKNKFSIAMPTIPGMTPTDGWTGSGTGGDEETGGTVSAISAGGSRNSSIYINLRSMVENMVFEGGYDNDKDRMQRDLENRLIQVLQMAKSTM